MLRKIVTPGTFPRPIITGGGPARPAKLGGLLRYPAFRGGSVARLGLDPARALGRLLELPERRLGLEPVDEEMAAGEGRLAMRRGGGDEHDARPGLAPAVAVGDPPRRAPPAPAPRGPDPPHR